MLRDGLAQLRVCHFHSFLVAHSSALGVVGGLPGSRAHQGHLGAGTTPSEVFSVQLNYEAPELSLVLWVPPAFYLDGV